MKKLYETVMDFLSSAADTTKVWIDCVAINQHSDSARWICPELCYVGSVGGRVCPYPAWNDVIINRYW